MPGISTLNRVRYAGLDFDTTQDEIRAQLQIAFASEFNDLSVSSLGIVLLDMIAFGLDTLMFYLDRRATDMYLSTARTRTSVALLTRQLGYKMAGAVASSVDLSVAPTKSYAFAIPIPKGFQFQGAGGAIYETAQTVTFSVGSTDPLSIPCYQGQTLSESFVSDGTPEQSFQLARVPTGAAIVQGTVQVIVNAAQFFESEFLTFDATNQFEIGYNDDPPTLRFGDGTAGNIPVKNGAVNVSYVATLGTAGGAISGTITKPVAPLSVMGQTIQLSATNPLATEGGSDLEDLTHAQIYAPRVFKSRGVAVTQGDYEALAGSYVDPLFGRVAVAQAISARSADQDLELTGLLDTITNSLASTTATITTALNDPSTGAYALAGLISAAVTQAQIDLSSIVVDLVTIDTNLTSSLASARSIKSNTSEIQADYGDAHSEDSVAKSNLSAFRSLIAGLPVASPSQLTSGDQTSYLATLDGLAASLSKIDGLLTLINGLAASAGASADSLATVLSATRDLLENTVGTDVTAVGTLVKDLSDQLSAIISNLGSATVPYTGVYADLHTIDDSKALNATTIGAATGDIFDHVDTILAADCEANLVVVPILARDASGFYAGPSNGLMRSLQAYLTGIKEVTQTVRVVSGAGFLVPAAITVRIGITAGTSDAITQASATTIVDGVLRDRAFGESLYLSDLITPLQTLTGLVFVNVTINGYRPVGGPTILTDGIDATGNLIIDDSHVITLSQSDFVVTTEVAGS